MKFEELDKDNQDWLIISLESEIDRFLEDEGIEEYELPTRQEYITFFNKFDEDYEIGDDGVAESTIESRYHKKMDISFDPKTKKVLLNVYDNDDDYDMF